MASEHRKTHHLPTSGGGSSLRSTAPLRFCGGSSLRSTAPYGFVVGLRCARPHPTVLWWVFALDRTLGLSACLLFKTAPQHHHFAKTKTSHAATRRTCLTGFHFSLR